MNSIPTSITGGTVEFIGKVEQKEQGCKAIYRLGDQTFYILLDDIIVAIDDSQRIGTPIEAIPPGTKGRIEKRDGNGLTSYELVFY